MTNRARASDKVTASASSSIPSVRWTRATTSRARSSALSASAISVIAGSEPCSTASWPALNASGSATSRPCAPILARGSPAIRPNTRSRVTVSPGRTSTSSGRPR